jgi:hypothetical protein
VDDSDGEEEDNEPPTRGEDLWVRPKTELRLYSPSVPLAGRKLLCLPIALYGVNIVSSFCRCCTCLYSGWQLCVFRVAKAAMTPATGQGHGPGLFSCPRPQAAMTVTDGGVRCYCRHDHGHSLIPSPGPRILKRSNTHDVPELVSFGVRCSVPRPTIRRDRVPSVAIASQRCRPGKKPRPR